MRYIVTGGILLATVAWLIVSYMPQAVATLPKWAFDSQFAQMIFPWLAAISLLIFLIIQLDLVRATAKWFRHPVHSPAAQALVDFGLGRNQELFWVVLPILGTVLLALWLLMVS
ncbi:MAG: hypothetical protein R6W76_11810 [Caldilinea sp.]